MCDRVSSPRESLFTGFSIWIRPLRSRDARDTVFSRDSVSDAVGRSGRRARDPRRVTKCRWRTRRSGPPSTKTRTQNRSSNARAEGDTCWYSTTDFVSSKVIHPTTISSSSFPNARCMVAWLAPTEFGGVDGDAERRREHDEEEATHRSRRPPTPPSEYPREGIKKRLSVTLGCGRASFVEFEVCRSGGRRTRVPVHGHTRSREPRTQRCALLLRIRTRYALLRFSTSHPFLFHASRRVTPRAIALRNPI